MSGRTIFATAVALVFLTMGCGEKPARQDPSFEFTVQYVFYIKPPVDRVILVGMVDAGQVIVGDAAVVRCRSGDVYVVVEGIETFGGQPTRARQGQQVGLRLRGITQDQPHKDDRVFGRKAKE